VCSGTPALHPDLLESRLREEGGPWAGMFITESPMKLLTPWCPPAPRAQGRAGPQSGPYTRAAEPHHTVGVATRKLPLPACALSPPWPSPHVQERTGKGRSHGSRSSSEPSCLPRSSIQRHGQKPFVVPRVGQSSPPPHPP